MAERIFTKAQPTVSGVHVNRPLTAVSTAYIQAEEAFIAARVFGLAPVARQGDLYYKYDQGDWQRSQAEVRAPATESAGGGWGLSTDSYFCHKYAIHRDVPDEIRANADAALSPDKEATTWATRQLMLIREITWATNYFTTGVWGSEGAPSVLWDVYATSDPLLDIAAQVSVIEGRTGYRPNTLVLSPDVWESLKDHPDVTDRIKYTQMGIVTKDLFASLIEVENVYVARAVQNTAAEGATDAISYIVGKHALLCYSNPSPSLMTPSAGYTFAWTGLLGAGALSSRVKKFRMEALESDRVEAEMAFDMKVVGANLGHLFSSAVT